MPSSITNSSDLYTVRGMTTNSPSLCSRAARTHRPVTNPATALSLGACPQRDFNNLDAEWSVSAFDRTHRLVANYVYEAPTPALAQDNALRELSVLYLVPPLLVISVSGLKRKDAPPYIEKVIVARLVFEDGSVWQAP